MQSGACAVHIAQEVWRIMFVITVDQKNSTTAGNRAAQQMRQLEQQHGESLLLPAAQFAGDELQLITDDPTTVAAVALDLAGDDWHVGIGIGNGSLSTSAADSHGTAFQAARDAVNAAKPLPWHIAVRSSEDAEAAQDCEAALALLQTLQSRRTDAGNEIAELIDRLGSVTAAAEHLGISVSAASKRARIAGLRHEQAGIELAERLLARADASTKMTEVADKVDA